MPDFSTFQGKPKEIDIFKGIYSHPNATTESNALEITANKNNVEISFDMINITQDTTIRVYEKVDDTNYRSVSQKLWTTDFPTNAEDAVVNLNGKDIDQKVTFQSAVLEGSIKSVPHARVEEIRSDDQ